MWVVVLQCVGLRHIWIENLKPASIVVFQHQICKITANRSGANAPGTLNQFEERSCPFWKFHATWRGRVGTCNFIFYFDTTQFEVSELRLQTVCTTQAQRLEREDVTFNVVRSPFLTSFKPFCSRLTPFPVSFSPFWGLQGRFCTVFTTCPLKPVHGQSCPFALRSQTVFNTIKTDFWVCCSPICYKYDHVLTRFHFDWGTDKERITNFINWLTLLRTHLRRNEK